MTGSEMKSIRAALGLSAVQLGRAVGYTGGDATIAVMISKYENGSRTIPRHLERLLHMFHWHGVPAGWTSKFPADLHTPTTDEGP
ncbi:MAG: hypothetical protein GX970_05465 [Phyllobacteriaceae bacterium]|nr:hypothetical protein [Phyllobacteriaceae bacterium]